ncbi:hypothetical protein DFH27DRAFT_628507 [Peziza echinospora]|nr:hypothetical protein DFH27DRAFT_628507 [Peziza echinospora]
MHQASIGCCGGKPHAHAGMRHGVCSTYAEQYTATLAVSPFFLGGLSRLHMPPRLHADGVVCGVESPALGLRSSCRQFRTAIAIVVLQRPQISHIPNIPTNWPAGCAVALLGALQQQLRDTNPTLLLHASSLPHPPPLNADANIATIAPPPTHSPAKSPGQAQHSRQDVALACQAESPSVSRGPMAALPPPPVGGGGGGGGARQSSRVSNAPRVSGLVRSPFSRTKNPTPIIKANSPGSVHRFVNQLVSLAPHIPPLLKSCSTRPF